jgi:aminoglycoside 3-N-acetyltransferase
MSKTCIDAEGVAHEIRSLVHDMSVVVKADAERFCREYVDPRAWVIFNRRFTPFFTVEAKAYCEAQIREAAGGNTIYYD